MSEERRVKCRWCTWSRPSFWTGKNGKQRSAFDALKGHVMDKHEVEMDAIEARLDAERDARKPVTRESWG